MEWVETTGRTIEEAKDSALDQLGVDEHDAEFEVLEEAKSGLFGRLRQEARVRARVRPTTPRAKAEGRGRKRKPAADAAAGAPADMTATEAVAVLDEPAAPATPAPAAKKRAPKREPKAATEPAKERPTRSASPKSTTGAAPMDSPDIASQAANIQSFLDGLLDAFDLDGEVAVAVVDDDTLEARVDGDDLGLLIGPKGQTLQSVQELARAVLQKEGPGGPRLRLDIGGYRERRRVALEKFTKNIAEQVLSSGTPTALEPMGAADRKVVHDTVNGIEGVETTSEGEEPRRRVVILPAED